MLRIIKVTTKMYDKVLANNQSIKSSLRDVTLPPYTSTASNSCDMVSAWLVVVEWCLCFQFHSLLLFLNLNEVQVS
jgi:hypothetical protein